MNDDLISRQAVLEIQAKYAEHVGATKFWQMRDDIKALPSVTPKQTRWIPVSERLPEKMGAYLVTLEYKEHGLGITTLWFHGSEIGWDLRVADIVIAWMPLPEPYMADKEEENADSD